MTTIKSNTVLPLLWLASCGMLIANFYYSENTTANNATFTLFLLLLTVTVGWHYRLKMPQPEQQPSEPIATHVDEVEKVENSVILLLGPYAAKWFNDPEAKDSTRFSSNAVWIFIPSPEALKRRLDYIAEFHPSAQIVAFFPFLPDVYETDAVLISQLNKWQNTFSELSLRAPLSCVFAIYAQLSNHRLSHDSNNAYWTGNINFARDTEISLAQAFPRLNQQLELQGFLGKKYSPQRHALGQSLFDWLNESGIAQTLQTLFQATSLRLTDVILTDNGKGFIRHGAWAAWLERTFGVLPGLGASLSLPPLPEVINTQKSRVIHVIKPRAPAPAPRPKWLWSLSLAALLLAVHILHTGFEEQRRQQAFAQEMVALGKIEELSVKGIGSALKELAAKGETLSSCVKASDITHWGLSQCRPMLKKVESRIDQYENIRAYSSSFVAPMFDSNSAELKDISPSNPTLAPLLVLLKSYPDRKILIVGHSDNTGSDAFNLALSEQRAINVRNWLLKYTPHTFNDFIIRGKGALEPIASNATKEGQTQNRRVEVLLIPSNEPEMETDIK